MSNIAPNLRYLRRKKGLTQQKFADLIGIKRSLVGAYEEYRAEPKYDLLKKMATFFNLSMDELAQDLINDEWKPKTVRDSSSLRILSITVDKKNKENIELVPQKASAGYLNGYADPEFVKELPRFSLPLFKDGTFRAFELKGDSMLPLDTGTIIIAEYVEHWNDIKVGKTYVVVSKSEGIVYKRLGNKANNEKGLKIYSDNKNYPPYWIELDDILEIWQAKAYLSTEFPEAQNGPTIDDISNMMLDMQKKLSDLKKR